MPIRPYKPNPIDVASLAAWLPRPVQKPAGMLGQVLADVLGADTVANPASPASQVMAVAAPVQLPDTPQTVVGETIGNFINRIKNPIKAYHGSPHDFNEFDLSKIGTGEGAQAYGHGLYFADQEGVARSYRDALAMGDPSGIRTAQPGQWDRASLDAAGGAVKDAGGDVSKAVQQLRARAQKLPNPVDVAAADRLEAGLYQIDPNGPGKMYEVNIHADPSTLLDWDKPLSQQPEAIQRIGRQALRFTDRYHPNRWNDLPGHAVMREIGVLANSQGQPGQRMAEDALKNAGINGIQYLDGGSRAAGEGSKNYVVFDDKLIEILRKYGLIPPTLGAMLANRNGGTDK